MQIQEYLTGCLEEAALVVSDGSRPFSTEEAASIARTLLEDPKLGFVRNGADWNPISTTGAVYLTEAIDQASQATGRALRFSDAKDIAAHLLWYELDLAVTYRP